MTVHYIMSQLWRPIIVGARHWDLYAGKSSSIPGRIKNLAEVYFPGELNAD